MTCDRTINRRRLLAGTAALGITGIAGCFEGDEQNEAPADPVSLDDGQACLACGMIIEDHYGPSGQLFYTGGQPEANDGVAWFDSVTELVTYHREQTDRGWELRDGFVTDYSAVDYELVERDGTTYITSHVDASVFADLTDLRYAVGSTVEGAMGEDFHPFSDQEDAAAFVDEHGGAVRSWSELL